MTAVRRTVSTADGLSLAIRRSGTPGRPVLIAVHGYPDDASVWDDVSELLTDDFDIVAYDVRGAGASSRPRYRRAYRLELLAADLARVIDEISPDEPVHLVAHDWGSVQAFYALRHGSPRVASYTSISGPDLDAARAWTRSQARGGPVGLARLGRQLASSAYIGAFLVPGPIELAIRSGRIERAVASDPSRCGRPVQRADLRDGLRLYRANMLRRRPPSTSSLHLPVQVIAPTGDRYVGPDLQTNIQHWVPAVQVHRPVAGHWVMLEDPTYVANRVRSMLL